jgi:hypothetical protein
LSPPTKFSPSRNRGVVRGEPCPLTGLYGRGEQKAKILRNLLMGFILRLTSG